MTFALMDVPPVVNRPVPDLVILPWVAVVIIVRVRCVVRRILLEVDRGASDLIRVIEEPIAGAHLGLLNQRS